MEDKLFLDDIEIELGDAQINRTLQINDFRKIEDRQGSYTLTIKVPKTPINIRSFDYLGILGDQSNKPFEEVKARIISSGVTLVRNGLAMIKSQHRDYYSVSIIDGIVPFWQEIKGKTVRDLDLTSLNHTVSYATAKQNYSNTEGFVYLFAFNGIHYIGTAQNSNGVYRNAPFLFVHTIWDKIFEEAGFTYSGDIFQTDDFRKLVVSLEKAPENNLFVFNETAPTISQPDFIKEFLIRFNLTHKLTGDNHFEFITLEEMLSDRENSIDWSDIFSHKESEVYKLGDYSKENQFSFESVTKNFSISDNYAGYKDGSFQLSNENLKESKRVFKSKFFLSRKWHSNSNLDYDGLMLLYKLWNINEGSGTIDSVETKPIIGHVGDNFEYDGGTDKLVISNSGVKHFELSNEEIGWQYILDKYYPKFIETIDKPRVLTAYFRINIKTLNDVDFFKLVFIKQTGRYYYINKIMNYNSKRPLTKVELIQVN